MRKPEDALYDSLEVYREAVQRGDPIAQLEVLERCFLYSRDLEPMPIPSWLAAALMGRLKDAAKRPTPGVRGRHRVPATRLADDQADMRRFSRVMRHRFHGKTLARALELALAELHEGPDAEPGLSEDALRASYKRTKKRAVADPARYLVG